MPLPTGRAHHRQGVGAVPHPPPSVGSRSHRPGTISHSQFPAPPSLSLSSHCLAEGEPWHGRTLGGCPQEASVARADASWAVSGILCHLAGTLQSVAFPCCRLSLPLSSVGPQMSWPWGSMQTRCPSLATMLHARRTVSEWPLADTALEPLTLELDEREERDQVTLSPEGSAFGGPGPVQEHLVAGWPMASSPQGWLADGCPGLPKPHARQRAPLPVLGPTRKPAVRTFACNSRQPRILVWLPAWEVASRPGKSTGFPATKSSTEDLNPEFTSGVIWVRGFLSLFSPL